MVIEAGMPMKPYLKHYVLWKENIGPDEILDLSESQSEISWVLAGCLTNALKYNFDKHRKLSKAYSEKLIFAISPKRIQYNMIYFAPPQIRYFNTFVYRQLHHHLLDRVMRGQARGIPEVDIIWEFMYETGIEPYANFEALKKANYRLRKSKNLPSFR